MYRTPLKITPLATKIDLDHSVLSLGSCFAEAMGQRMKTYKLDSTVNPFGVIFNPVSIFKLLEYALSDTSPKEDTYLQREGYYFNYDFHSQFTTSVKDSLVQEVERCLQQVNALFPKLQWLIITFGTAYVYQRKIDSKIVANCHKVPNDQFDKRLLTTKEIISGFENVYSLIRNINPQLNIILTVSPVRHIKDTLTLNGVSKATLRVACHHLSEQNERVNYFPAFEMMMDDLRDYRFYADDMLHPSTVAEDYIWSQLQGAYFSEETNHFIRDWQEILRAMQHRPFQENADRHQAFLKKTLAKLHLLKMKADVRQEIEALKKKIL